MEEVTKKRAEINQFKGEFKGLSIDELNKSLLVVCSSVIQNYPNSYPSKLSVNNKYCALQELIKESKP